jgi:hypothetical protein
MAKYKLTITENEGSQFTKIVDAFEFTGGFLGMMVDRKSGHRILINTDFIAGVEITEADL